MKLKIFNRFKTEIDHFNSLPSDAKKILLSFIFFNLANALILIFVNVFLWRKSNHGLGLVIAYNTAFSFVLPFSFIFNGYLLRKFKPQILYWLGLVVQGLAYLLVIYLPTNFWGTVFNGLLEGFGGGLFWANKNYLTLRFTKNANRIYFNNIESISSIIINLFIPFFAGWFISLANNFHFYSEDMAYRFLALMAFILMFFSGYLVQTSSELKVKVKSIFYRHPSSTWKLNRAMHFFTNIPNAVSWFLPSILIMTKVTSEGILGTVNSISSILIALLLYYLGRKSKLKHLVSIILIANLLYFLNSGFLIVSFTFISVLFYSFLNNPLSWLRFIPVYTISMELMDQEQSKHEVEDQYSLVVDNEIIFNLGRLVGLGLLTIILHLTSVKTTLKIIPLLLSILSLGIIYPLFKLKPQLKKLNGLKATD